MPTTSQRRTRAYLSGCVRLLLFCAIAGAGLLLAPPAQAASVTWTGLGSTNNWSDGANWSTGSAPAVGDIAIFNATATKNATINAAVNVAGIQIAIGYTGTITQVAATTVGSSGFSQADGTFIGSGSAVTVNGPFNLSSGNFTSTSGTLSVSGDYTHTVGVFTPNGGTVRLTGGAATITVPVTETLNNLILAPTTAGAAKTVVTGNTLIVQGTLTLTEGLINTGTVAAQGAITQASTFDGGTGLLIVNGVGDQLFTGTATTGAGSLPNLEFDKPAGTLTLAGTLRTTRGWTYTAGALDPGTSTVVFAGTLTVTGPHSLNAVEIRGAVTVAGGTTLTAASLNMPSSVAFTVNGSVIVNGTLTLTDGSIAGTGTLSAHGDVTQASTFDGGTGSLTIDGAGAQSFTGSATTAAGDLPTLTINKPAGTLTLAGTLRTTHAWTYTAGALDPGTSTVVFAGTLTVTGPHSLNAVEIRGAVTIAGGTTLTAASLNMPSSVAFTINGSVTVTATLTLTDGSINTGTVAAQGAITQASTFDGGTGLLIVNGVGDQLFTGTATTGAGSLPNLEFDKPAGTLTLAGTLRTTRGWTYTAGALDPGTSTVVFAGTLTVTGPHSLNAVEIRGAVTVAGGTTLTAASLNMPSSVAFTVNGSVIVNGTLTLTDGSIAGTGTLSAHGDVTQASTFDGGTGSLTIDGAGAQSFTGSATTAAGDLPALTINKPAGTLSLAGTIRTTHAWTYTAGALDPGTSTVVFAGTLTVTGPHSLNAVEIRGAVTIAGGTTLTAASLNMPSSVAFTINGSVTVTATLTLTDGSINTGTVAAQGAITQASTFDGGTGLLIVNGVGDQLFTGTATTGAGSLPSLEFDKPAGTLTLAGTLRTTRGWTYTAGALDPGTSTVVFAGTLTVTGSHALANVTFNGGNSNYTVASGTTVTVTGALTLTDGSINTGTVAAQGAITQASTFDGGTGLLIVNGVGDQLFTGTATTGAGSLPNLEFDKPAGTLTLAGTLRTTRGWTYTAGALDPGTSTVVFAGTLTVTGSHALANVTFNGGNSNYTVASGTTVTVTGALTLTDGSINTGTVAASGNLTQASTFDGGTGLLIVNGVGDQLFTGTATTGAGSLPNLEFDKPAGTLTLAGTLRTTRGWTYTAGALDPGTSTVVFAGTLTVTGSHALANVTFNGGNSNYTVASGTTVTVTGALTLTDGSINTGTVAASGNLTQASTFDGGTGLLIVNGVGDQLFTGTATTGAGSLPNLEFDKPAGTLTLAGTLRTTRGWTYTAGALDPGTSTVVFAGTLTVTGPHSLNAVEIRGAVTVAGGTTLTAASLNMPSSVAFTVNGSVIVNGTLTLTDGSIAGTGTLSAHGDVTQASTFDGGTGLLIVNGVGDQVFTGTATTSAGSLPNLEFDKPAGTLTLAGTLRTTHNWTYTAGTLDPGTSTVVFAGTELVSAAGMSFSSVTVASATLSSGVTLVQGPLVVAGTLSLVSGTITTGASKVVVSSSGDVVRTSGHVIGDLQKSVPIGSSVSVGFEIGDVSAYTPVVVSFGTVTAEGDLTASTVSGDHPDIANSGVSATSSVNRWWTITSSGIAFDSYGVILNFVAGDLDPSADPSRFIVAKKDATIWTETAVAARSATSIEAGAMTSFSDYVVGEPAADVRLTMVGSPEPVLVGANLTYALNVSNAGPSPASSVTLTDTLPTGVVFVSATSSQGSCTESNGTVICDLGALAPNATATLTIAVSASVPGSWVNTATLTSTEADPDPTNNAAAWTSTVNPAADVRLTMVGSPEPVLVGANLTYALNVSNAGPSPASSVTLTDTLPTGVVFVSATSSQGSCTESNGTVTCDLGALAPNATATLTIAVSASVPGSWVNTATLTSTEADPDPTNNAAAWTSTVNPASPRPASGSPDASMAPTGSSGGSSRTNGPAPLPRAVTGTAGSSAALITSLLTPTRPSAPPSARAVRQSDRGPEELHGSMTETAVVFGGLLAFAVLLGIFLVARRDRSR